MARRVGAWPARRVGLAAVAGLLLVSAAWLGGQGPVGAQEAEAEAAADPKSVAEVRISGLSGTLTYGGRDSFTVTASNLTTVVGYDVIVSRTNGTLGIGACGTGSQTQRVSGVTSQDLRFTVRACAAGSGTVTAVVRRSGLTINEHAYRQGVTVQARAPLAPARPTAPNPKPREFTAQWQAPGDTGGTALTGYHVLMRPNGAAWPPDSQAKNVGASTRSQRFSGLTPNRIYWFKVKACNGATQTRCSGWSPQASVTLPIGTPEKPTWGDFDRKPTEITVHWSAPDDTGGVGLTGYGLRHWRKGASEPSSAQAVVNAQTTSRTFTSLAANTPYRFSIQACNGPSRCSGWTNKDGRTDPTPTPPPPPDPTTPGRVGRPAIDARDAALHVDWKVPSDGGSAITHYDVQHRAGRAGAWTATEVRTRTSTTISGLTNGTSYQVQVRAVNNRGDGEWSEIVTGTPSDLAPEPDRPGPPGPTSPVDIPDCGRVTNGSVTAPTGLNVIPLSGHKASMTWIGTTGATGGYVVDIKRSGTDWSDTSSVNSHGVPGGAMRPCFLINLDNVTLGPVLDGLAHHSAFDVRVRALVGTDTRGTSETITIIDTLITKADGHVPESAMRPIVGQADITWTTITSVLGDQYADGKYILRRRRLGDDHVTDGWRPNVYHATDFGDTQETSNTQDSIGGLTPGQIYAVQLVYLPDEDANTADTMVFAARNTYVWPSTDTLLAAGSGLSTKFAGLEVRSRLATAAYDYHICIDTFTENDETQAAKDRRQAWIKYIVHALDRWEVATNNTVRMNHLGESCTNYQVIIDMAAEQIGHLMPTETSQIESHLVAFVQHEWYSQILPANKADSDKNEIIMFDDLADYSPDGPLYYAFTEAMSNEPVIDTDYPQGVEKIGKFGNRLGYVSHTNCWGPSVASGKGAVACAQFSKGASASGYTTDIILLRTQVDHDPLDIPSHDLRLNSCPKPPDYFDWLPFQIGKPRNRSSVYGTLIHEAGHALGIDHPTRPDLVTAADTVMSTGTPLVGSVKCFPHPLDVLAVYALHRSR